MIPSPIPSPLDGRIAMKIGVGKLDKAAHAPGAVYVIRMEWSANGVTQHVESHMTKAQFDEFVRDCIRVTDGNGIDA